MKFLSELREMWDGNLVVKGVMDHTDALAVKEAGADALWVSSHGCRQLDAAPPAISELPKIRAAVGESYPLFFDSGLRSGEDILRAYSQGANFVFVGKYFLLAAAAQGARGPALLSDNLASQIKTALTLTGQNTITSYSDP